MTTELAIDLIIIGPLPLDQHPAAAPLEYDLQPDSAEVGNETARLAESAHGWIDDDGRPIALTAWQRAVLHAWKRTETRSRCQLIDRQRHLITLALWHKIVCGKELSPSRLDAQLQPDPFIVESLI